MATKYWVGGSGTWDATTNTNWSSTGAAGTGGTTSAPTASDDVIFGANAGTGTVTISSGTANSAQINIGTLTFSFSGTSLFIASSFTNTVSFTTTGSGTISIYGTSVTFGGVGVNYTPSVALGSTTATSITINGANTFSSLTLPSPAGSVGIIPVYFGANQTITSLTASGVAYNRRLFLRSDTTGVQRTLSITTWSGVLQDMDFRDIAITGVTPVITRSGDCGNNSNTSAASARAVYYANTAAAGAQSWSSTVWATTAGGTAGNNAFPLAQDSAIISDTSGGGAAITLTFDKNWNIGTFDTSGRNTVSLSMGFVSGATTISVWGNTVFTGGACSGSGSSGYFKISKPNATITTSTGSATSYQGLPFTIDVGTGNSVSLTGTPSNWYLVPTTATSGTAILTLLSGTLNLAGKNVYTGVFNVLGSGQKTLDFNASTSGTVTNGINILGSINCDTANNLTIGNARSSTGFVKYGSQSGTWVFNGATLNCGIIDNTTGGANALTFGTNFTCTSLRFSAGSVCYFGNGTITIADSTGAFTPTFYSVGSSSAKPLLICTAGSTAQCTFYMPSSSGSVSIDYTDFVQIGVISPVRWNTGTNSSFNTCTGFNTPVSGFLSLLTVGN